MIKRLQQEILTALPGWEAHEKMAPPIRKPLPNITNTVRQSAVCILLYYKNKALHTILIKRTEDGKTHGGQISFPGGRLDDNDFSHTFCALRECEEEIGLPTNRVSILGAISKLYIPPSNFLVTPIVCFSDKVKNLIPSENEVAAILEVSIAEIFNKNNKQTKAVWRSDDKSRSMQTPIYQFREHTIWGATAMILSEFEEIYNRISKK